MIKDFPASKVESVCLICNGTGWKPAGNGRVTRCDCRMQARSQTLLAAAGIPKRYEHCELSNFKFDGEYRGLANARLAAYRFVEEYPLDKTGLVFTGKIGVGKTHLAIGIIRALATSKGVSCAFYDYRTLLKEIQHSYNESVKTTELDILRPVFETEVLVLDELGTVKRATDWVWDTVNLILNTRYNDGLTTIVTTNFPDLPERDRPGNTIPITSKAYADYASGEETLGDRIGERMRSRLLEMCRVVKMEGRDYRETLRKNGFG